MSNITDFINLLITFIMAIILYRAISMKPNTPGESSTWPFVARKPLSEPEQNLYFRICQALPCHIVLAQVALPRLLGMKNKSKDLPVCLEQSVADFVVCTKEFNVLAVIEVGDMPLEDNQPGAGYTDKTKAIIAAGIRVIRWSASRLPDEETIREAFFSPSSDQDRRTICC